MVYLRSLQYSPPHQHESFPFSLSLFQNLTSMTFAPITILVGENGAGKSTLLEAMAAKLNLQTFGEFPINRDPSLQAARSLMSFLRFTWSKKIHRGFFLRSEDFFAYLKRIEQERQTSQADLLRTRQTYQHHSKWARMKAESPYKSTLNQISMHHGENADGQSHGEGYLALFRDRLHPGGIYLIDEAEAALSPISQLGLVHLILDTVEQGAQFILATHSPILMAIPDARILSCDEGQLVEMQFDDLAHVQFYRDFLAHPGAFLRR